MATVHVGGRAEQFSARLLELFVLEGINKRIDTAVGKDSNNGEVIERWTVDGGQAQVEGEEKEGVPDPAETETGADDNQCLNGITGGPAPAVILSVMAT